MVEDLGVFDWDDDDAICRMRRKDVSVAWRTIVQKRGSRIAPSE